jgi:beta-glucosidase
MATDTPNVPAVPDLADVRARQTEAKMTDEERFSLLVSVMGANTWLRERDRRIPEGVPMSAGYVPGISRLGIPPLLMSDASLGVTNPGYREGDTATALPAGTALASSFDPALARESGAVVGREARSRGFNVQLAGGINLARDPRNGRNFEYLSEDPLLSGALAAESINGIQAQGVISTIKHFCLNCNETNRHWLDAIIDPDAHRESDLLAFEIAIERSRPGSVMTAYNKVNGDYAGANKVLIQDVLKTAWGYQGWVMSDWGATSGWEFAVAGLDQESGAQIDVLMWGGEAFSEPLKQAYADGQFPSERLSEMVRRILRSIYAVGVDAWSGPVAIDMAQHNEVALRSARRGIVLLKNEGVLPLSRQAAMKLAVIGGYAHAGVPTGSGSSTVTPPGGYAAVIPIGGPGFMGNGRALSLLPSSPLSALRELLPHAQVEFDPGMSPVEAAALARRSDIAIVFGIRLEGEGFDNPDLSLPWGQDGVIAAVAAANPKTVVVLETGNPVAMPWHDDVSAVVEAWYPGQAGGQAIAEVLSGVVNPSGRLPITFPADLSQTPRPELPGRDMPWGSPITVDYREGAEVGYRWFAQTGAKPLYPFGYGLSYTSFAYSDLVVQGGQTVTATFVVTNTGNRDGADVPQLYLTEAAGDKRVRLLGFERAELAPGESRRLTLVADPRLLARFDGATGQWHLIAGSYRVGLGPAAGNWALTAETTLEERRFGS